MPEGRLMVRRLAVLVMAALLVSAVLPGSLAAADPKGSKLSKEDHAQLANIRMTTRGDFDGSGREDGLAREISNLHQVSFGVQI